MLQNDLSNASNSITSQKKLVETIFHVTKNYYNSKSIFETNKAIIKRDRKVKYIILEILRKRGIFEESGDQFNMNENIISNQILEFENNSSQKLLTSLHSEIKSIVGGSW